MLILFIIHLVPRQENYTNYDETSCVTLAKQNQDNIESLQKDVNTLLTMQSQIQGIKNATDANANQLKTMVNQVYKTPSV